MTKSICSISMLAVLWFCAVAPLRAADAKLATIHFVVLRDYNGKPVRNASVVLHPVNDTGKQKRNGLELKADGDGKAGFDGLPYGKWRVQVLATGFQTYGEDYDVNQQQIEITVKLRRPQEQYSIYKDSPAPDAGAEKKDDKKDAPKADAPK